MKQNHYNFREQREIMNILNEIGIVFIAQELIVDCTVISYSFCLFSLKTVFLVACKKYSLIKLMIKKNPSYAFKYI